MWDIFEVVSIEKTASPEVSEKGHWYNYIIANKSTQVKGCRRGSKEEVTQFVNGCVQRLNSRHLSAVQWSA